MPTSSTFTIRELTGQTRTVVMQQRGLPYRPFTLKTKQRVSVSWNPGYSIGTGNVMGATEEPTTITGAWRTKFLGDETAGPCIAVNGTPVLTSREAVTLFDSLCREGQELEVTWDEDTRVGYLEEIESSRLNINDIDYSMTFEWISRGQAATAVVLATTTSVAGTAGTTRGFVDRFAAIAETPPYPVTPGFTAKIAAALVAFDGATNRIEAVVANAALVTTSPLMVVSAIVTQCNVLINTGKALRDVLDSTVASSTNSIANIKDQTYGQTLEALEWTRELRKGSRDILSLAVATRAANVNRIENELLAVYEARQGDDLRSISQTYYRTPFQWQTLAVFNNLSDFTLSPGDIILIPKISALTGS